MAEVNEARHVQPPAPGGQPQKQPAISEATVVASLCEKYGVKSSGDLETDKQAVKSHILQHFNQEVGTALDIVKQVRESDGYRQLPAIVRQRLDTYFDGIERQLRQQAAPPTLGQDQGAKMLQAAPLDPVAGQVSFASKGKGVAKHDPEVPPSGPIAPASYHTPSHEALNALWSIHDMEAHGVDLSPAGKVQAEHLQKENADLRKYFDKGHGLVLKDLQAAADATDAKDLDDLFKHHPSVKRTGNFETDKANMVNFMLGKAAKEAGKTLRYIKEVKDSEWYKKLSPEARASLDKKLDLLEDSARKALSQANHAAHRPDNNGERLWQDLKTAVAKGTFNPDTDPGDAQEGSTTQDSSGTTVPPPSGDGGQPQTDVPPTVTPQAQGDDTAGGSTHGEHPISQLLPLVDALPQAEEAGDVLPMELDQQQEITVEGQQRQAQQKVQAQEEEKVSDQLKEDVGIKTKGHAATIHDQVTGKHDAVEAERRRAARLGQDPGKH